MLILHSFFFFVLDVLFGDLFFPQRTMNQKTAGFPSTCFYALFGVSLWKWAMERPNLKIYLVMVFDICKNCYMHKICDLANNELP